MSVTNTTLVGVFDDTATAQRVVQDLVDNGFNREYIQVTGGGNYASDAARGNTGLTGEVPRHESGGGISGFFHNLFGSDEDDSHEHYAEAVRRGSAVVTVRADEARQDMAADIMNRHGAVDIDRRVASWRDRGYDNYDATATPLSDQEIAREREHYQGENTEQVIPVIQEELQVGKRVVNRGGVRVYQQTSEQPVEEQVNLREEHVRVERRPANRAATEADLSGRDQVIELTEMNEEAVVSKQARVVEEVIVGKESKERTETVRDKVRRTDVKVEDAATTQNRTGSTQGSGFTSDYDTDFRNDFQTRYGNVSGATYETYGPAYQYGYRMASDPQYKGRNWNDVESTLKTDYLRNNPNSTWDNMKGAVRYGWEKVTGKR